MLLLSETWIGNSENTNLDIEGYSCEHIFGNKSRGTKKDRFSGGISVYYKYCYRDKIHIVEKHQCGILWLKIQNDVFQFNEDVYICNLYIPPHGSKALNTQEIDIYEVLEQDVLRFKDRGKLFTTGDFNGRIASETGVLDFDRYLDDETLYDFIDKTLLTTRVNKDNVVDSYGRRLLSFCKITDLIIANGWLGEDSGLGQYTFVSHNGLSYTAANS